MIKNAIFVKKLTCSFDDRIVLDSISFTIPSRSTCVVIGPSGCGKTTLLHLDSFVQLKLLMAWYYQKYPVRGTHDTSKH